MDRCSFLPGASGEASRTPHRELPRELPRELSVPFPQTFPPFPNPFPLPFPSVVSIFPTLARSEFRGYRSKIQDTGANLEFIMKSFSQNYSQ